MPCIKNNPSCIIKLMKRIILALTFALTLTTSLLAQEESIAVSRVYDIEDLKGVMLLDEVSASALKPELASLYEELEGATYLERSSGKHLSLCIGSYSVKDQAWRLHIRSDFFSREDLFDVEFLLPYSDVLGKRFVEVEKMTEAQLADYEEKVTLYDELIHTKENVLQAELFFKIFRWTGSSEYYFVPVECNIINANLKNKVVYSLDEKILEAKKVQLLPKQEVRSEGEIIQDKRRAQLLLSKNFEIEKENRLPENNTESQTETPSSSETEKTQKIGRREVLVQVSAEKADWVYESFNDIRAMQPLIQGSFCFSIFPFLYAGLGVGFKAYVNSFYIDGFAGLNYRLGSVVNPFAQVGIKAFTDNTLDLHAGGGIDFNLGPMVLMLGYDYNWSFELNTGNEKEMNGIQIGAGLSW